jgi:hypothetical protein
MRCRLHLRWLCRQRRLLRLLLLLEADYRGIVSLNRQMKVEKS